MSPSRAEFLELRQPLVPPPGLPVRPAFEELLFTFADPERALEGGFSVPSLSLAVRARAWAFVGRGTYERREALDTLAMPARDATLSELPGGRQLAALLELGPEAGQLRVRELGPWLRGPDSPLQEALRSALVEYPGLKTAAVLTGGAAVLGLVHQFGTAQASSLGLSPVLRGSTLGGHLDASVQLHAQPRFRDVRGNMVARLRLPELSPALRIEQLEVGGTAAHTPEGLLLDTRWVNLRARLSWLTLSMGVHSSHAEPDPWMNVETSLQRESFGLRAVVSRQWESARSRTLGTATLRTGPVLSGLFIGLQGDARSTFGLVSMGAF
jgi:hypothetical protein